MDNPWQIGMLGWLRATQGDRVVSRFRTHKTGAPLAYLAYHHDGPVAYRKPQPRAAGVPRLSSPRAEALPECRA